MFKNKFALPRQAANKKVKWTKSVSKASVRQSSNTTLQNIGSERNKRVCGVVNKRDNYNASYKIAEEDAEKRTGRTQNDAKGRLSFLVALERRSASTSSERARAALTSCSCGHPSCLPSCGERLPSSCLRASSKPLTGRQQHMPNRHAGQRLSLTWPLSCLCRSETSLKTESVKMQ